MFSISITFVAAALLVPGIVLMILGIIAGGKKRVAAITVALVIHLSVLFVAGKIYYDYNHIIGTFSGIEYDMITIDGETYKADYDYIYAIWDYDGQIFKKI